MQRGLRLLVQLVQVVAVFPAVVEDLRRRVRRLEHWDARVAQDLTTLLQLLAAHPRRVHRLALDVRVLRQLHRRLRRLRHRLRRQDHQHAVALLVVASHLQRLRVHLWRRVTQHVHRVVVRPRARQERVVLLHRLGRDLRQLTAARHDLVRRDHAGTARVRDHRHARTRRQRLLVQRRRHVVQLLDRVHTHHARLLERRRQHVVRARQRARVRRGGSSSGSRATRLDHVDGLAQRHLARRGDERASVADRLHVDHDRLRVRVVAEVVDQITPVHVHHRADRHERRVAQTLLQRPVQHGAHQRAALADERDLALQRHLAGERRVQTRGRNHRAQAVGADDAHVVLASLLQARVLQSRALLAHLLEAGGDDDDAAHSGLAALRHRAQHALGGNADDRQIHLLGHVADALVRLDAEDLVSGRIHGVHTATEGSDEEVEQNGTAHASRTLRSADQSDVVRLEDGVKLITHFRGKTALQIGTSAIPCDT